MNCLAILLFSLWAKGCFAGTCVPNNTVDFSNVTKNYITGSNCVPVPILESGDDAAGAFRDAITEALQIYGGTLLNNLICQAVDMGNRWVDCINKTSHKLQQTIESLISKKEKSIHLDEELEQLTNQLNKVMELKPGIVLIKGSAMPQILQQQVDVQSRTTKRTAKELFLELNSIVNGIAVNVLRYMTAQYLEGWRNSGPDFDISSQIRDKILNDKILAASRAAVDKVYERKDLVQRNVLPETWKCFKDTAGRIKEISNAYNASKNGEETCSLCTDCIYG